MVCLENNFRVAGGVGVLIWCQTRKPQAMFMVMQDQGVPGFSEDVPVCLLCEKGQPTVLEIW